LYKDFLIPYHLHGLPLMISRGILPILILGVSL